MSTYNFGARTIRMLPPANPIFTTLNGRVINGSAGYVDVAAADAVPMSANGWIKLMESGPTASRPQPGPAASPAGYNVQLGAGQPYLDTTLGAVIFWNPVLAAWVNTTNTPV